MPKPAQGADNNLRAFSEKTEPSLKGRANAPIGVFDSGVGGLTVVQNLFEVLPNETILYVADQAHVPYGGRELSEIEGFATGTTASLLSAGCKAVVMACNISSAVALASVEKIYPTSIIAGVIRYGAAVAAETTRNGKVGVLTTEGTRKSGAYTRELRAIQSSLAVLEVGCPKFVPLVEAGEVNSREAFAAAEEYLSPLLALGADTVILGCTHYPYLLDALQAIAPEIIFVDPAEATARGVAQRLADAELLRSRPTDFEFTAASPCSLLTTTGDAQAFRQNAPRFLKEPYRIDFASATWQQGKLILPIPVSA